MLNVIHFLRIKSHIVAVGFLKSVYIMLHTCSAKLASSPTVIQPTNNQKLH